MVFLQSTTLFLIKTFLEDLHTLEAKQLRNWN